MVSVFRDAHSAFLLSFDKCTLFNQDLFLKNYARDKERKWNKMLGSCTENINTYVKVKCYLIDVTFAIHLKTTLKVNTLKAKTSRNHCVHFNYKFFFFKCYPCWYQTFSSKRLNLLMNSIYIIQFPFLI